jgi:hypothetical protein
MGSLRMWMAWMLLFGLTAGAQGQVDATSDAKSEAAAGTMQVTLGQAATELTGPWRFHTGDNMGWAATDFDDSSWGLMDLTPPSGSANAELGISGFIPGWTQNGYPHYAGYAWYRLRVNVKNEGGSLSIKMPSDLDDAYQLYVNGAQIGEFGTFTEHGVTTYSSLPRTFRLPHGLKAGPITIAVRLWMDSATPLSSPDAGGMHEPPVLGHTGVIRALITMDWDAIGHYVGSGFLEMLILLLAWVVAISLMSMDRTEPAYLWLSLVCAVTLLLDGIVLIVNFSTEIGLVQEQLLEALLAALRIGLWVIFWGYWFRVVRMNWVHRVVWTLVLLLIVGSVMLKPPLYGHAVPVHASAYLQPALLALKLCFVALLFAITFRGIRKEKTEGWLALSAVMLVVISLYQRELRLLHVRTGFEVLGFTLSLGTISTIFSLLLITVMLLRRFLHSQRKKEQWKAEIEQARQVQHVLIPVELPTVVGLSIESDYRPAREVGGDFFQILPVAEDGSVLIVVGDVTGKGLQAGMLVALIVGSIRTAVLYSTDPLELLSTLNERLCDRGRASATGLILRIKRDGAVTLANAGHLSPYLNGKEMEMEGALPMGVVAGADFHVQHFTLEPGDTLMLMSDGIAEAQDEHKNLFGFERVTQMLQEPISAAELATAAQEFGQEDDILVLRVQRDRTPTVKEPERELVAGR